MPQSTINTTAMTRNLGIDRNGNVTCPVPARVIDLSSMSINRRRHHRRGDDAFVADCRFAWNESHASAGRELSAE
jgi:hypothetical protein